MKFIAYNSKRWRDTVNHSSPKALRIRAAVEAIHARGEYPGLRRVMTELGEPQWRETTHPSWIDADGEPLVYRTQRWMSGRDNVVRKAVMKELGIDLDPGPDYDYDEGYW